MTDFKPGDRVLVEGVFEKVNPCGLFVGHSVCTEPDIWPNLVAPIETVHPASLLDDLRAENEWLKRKAEIYEQALKKIRPMAHAPIVPSAWLVAEKALDEAKEHIRVRKEQR
ncbi:MAG: hypothetical protein ABFD91_13170 [Anaerohalosphaeraceae bacterium]|nr:hypothetical protein [Chloroflexota bacterium]